MVTSHRIHCLMRAHSVAPMVQRQMNRNHCSMMVAGKSPPALRRTVRRFEHPMKCLPVEQAVAAKHWENFRNRWKLALVEEVVMTDCFHNRLRLVPAGEVVQKGCFHSRLRLVVEAVLTVVHNLG
jgi:hypothetical protein